MPYAPGKSPFQKLQKFSRIFDANPLGAGMDYGVDYLRRAMKNPPRARQPASGGFMGVPRFPMTMPSALTGTTVPLPPTPIPPTPPTQSPNVTAPTNFSVPPMGAMSRLMQSAGDYRNYTPTFDRFKELERLAAGNRISSVAQGNLNRAFDQQLPGIQAGMESAAARQRPFASPLYGGGVLTAGQAAQYGTGQSLGIPPNMRSLLESEAMQRQQGLPELNQRFGAYEAARANVSPAGFPINAGQPFTRYNAQTGQTEVVQPMAPMAPGGAPPMAEAPIRSMGANTEARLQGALSKNDWDRLSFDAKNAGVSPSKRTLEQMTPEEQMRIARSPYPASIAALNEGPLRADAKKTYQEKQRWDLYRQWGRKLGYSEEDMANVTADERDKFIQAMGEQRQQDYQLSKKEQRDQSKQMRVLRAQQEDYANRLRQGKVVPTTDEWLQMNPQSELAQKMMLQDRAFQQKMIENEQIINAGKYAQQSQYRRLAQEALRTGNQELADRYAQLANMEESSRGMGGVVGAPAAPEQDAATVGRANAITAMKDAWGGSMWRTRGGAESKLRNVIRAMKSNPNFTPEQYSLFLKELANTPEGQEMLNATNLAPDIRQFLYGQVQFDKKGRLLTLPRDYTVPSAPIRTGV